MRFTAVFAAGFLLMAPAAFAAPQAANDTLRQLSLRNLQPDFLDGFLVLAVLVFAISAGSIIAWWNARHISIFRTLAAYMFTIALVDFVDFRGLSWEWIPTTIACGLGIELFAEALRIPKRPWIWISRLVWIALLGIGFFAGLDWYHHQLLELWALRLTLFPSLVLVVIGIWRGGRRERLMSIPLALIVLAYLPTLPEIRMFAHVPFGFVAFGWLWQWGECVQILLGAVIFNVFLRELFADQREKQRLLNEVEAARIVQQVLIPEAIPTVPGFRTVAVYKPFGEVGGDFFQILPAKNNGVLIAIGDVSGKGVPAAMTVALLVGTFRTLAHYTESPGEILAAMNQRMLGRSNGGFTTCLVLRVDANGALTAGNAGHLPPYLDGKELGLDSGLPLGLSAGAAYAESCFRLATDSTLTLLTDGVVEARNSEGELFGFDRTASITLQSADEIAGAAQQFGQEDDITVLTLTFAGAPARA